MPVHVDNHHINRDVECLEMIGKIDQDVRVKLRDEDQIYDKEMLSLMRRLRCKADNTRPECAQKRE